MKGLFLKDVALMKNQLRSIWIVAIVAVFMMIINILNSVGPILT